MHVSHMHFLCLCSICLLFFLLISKVHHSLELNPHACCHKNAGLSPEGANDPHVNKS